MRLSRRHALKLAAAAALGPTFWTSRARAATAAFGAAKHVLILNCRGGFRAHATFNAVGAIQHNPFGTQPSTAAWTLGAACGSKRYTTSLGTVPSFAEVASDVCVLACVDPNKGGVVEIDHVAGQRRVGTGLPDGRNGLLSLVGAHHALYRDGFSAAVLPPVEIGPSDLGLGQGVYGATRPLSLFAGQGGLQLGADIAAGDDWHAALRQGLDERFLARRSRAYAKRLEAFRLAKHNASLFLGVLQDPRFNLRGAPEVSEAGVTNGQLLEVLGDHDLREIGDPQAGMSWGADIALALRCFGSGAPVVAVTHDGFDMHDIERDAYGPRSEDLVRQLAGLNFLLKRMPHAAGGTYFDHTVVLTISEFSRNNTFESTGFNSGNGSDHVGSGADPVRNMATAVMGGPVTRPGALIGATDDAMKATGAIFSTADLLSTVLDLVGVDPTDRLPGRPIQELFA